MILVNRARRVSLTVAGDAFLEEARRILRRVDRAHERMQEVARGAVGRIRLGATATPGLYLLPALLAKYRSKHESYDLRFEIGSIHAIAERVARNDLDMGIVAGALPSGELQARALSRDELVVIAPPNSPLVRARVVKPNQLRRGNVAAPRGRIRYPTPTGFVVAPSADCTNTNDDVR